MSNSKNTQKQVLIKHLYQVYSRDLNLNKDERGWTRAYSLRGINTDFGFSGHQSDRRLRELAQAGKVEHRIKDKYAEYRHKPYVPLTPEQEEIRKQRLLFEAMR